MKESQNYSLGLNQALLQLPYTVIRTSDAAGGQGLPILEKEIFIMESRLRMPTTGYHQFVDQLINVISDPLDYRFRLQHD